jgi:CheY-like chemotaxis protein
MSPASNAHLPGTRVSVLVIDDDLDIRETLAEILRDEGYSVVTAIHGAHALELLTSIRPAVILLDLNMPVMNGKQFREAQRRDPSLVRIPTVVMTAVDRIKDLTADLSVEEALPKPIKLPDLLSIMRRYSTKSPTREGVV